MAVTFETTYTPHGARRFSVELRGDGTRQVHLYGEMTDVVPAVRGEAPYVDNLALVNHLWAHAKHEAHSRRLRSEDKREGHAELAAEHLRTAIGIAEMLARTGSEQRLEWCSACLTQATFTKVRWHNRPRSTWLCGHCGSPTTPCLAPRCSHMAVRGTKAVALPHYCAEHRHDVPGFAKLAAPIPGIDAWPEWLDCERTNLSRTTKRIAAVLLGGAAVVPVPWRGPGALGGVVGTLTGVSGTAATNHGLAALGGGAIARGGLGVGGGTLVVAPTGDALGGAVGGAASAAFVAADSSFRITQVRDGVGAPVLVASGFPTGKDGGWARWQELVDARYRDRPVHLVHWGARELAALGQLDEVGTTRAASASWVKRAAAGSMPKPAPRSSWLGWILEAKGVAANPWTVASTRATMTGAVLADLIARTGGPYALVGHSLGARVMATAAKLLGTREGAPLLEDVHLLGAALSRGRDWRSLDASVSGHVWNYWSGEDWVLGHLCPDGSGRKAVGHRGFSTRLPRIKDRDVSRRVAGHGAYFDAVALQG